MTVKITATPSEKIAKAKTDKAWAKAFKKADDKLKIQRELNRKKAAKTKDK